MNTLYPSNKLISISKLIIVSIILIVTTNFWDVVVTYAQESELYSISGPIPGSDHVVAVYNIGEKSKPTPTPGPAENSQQITISPPHQDGVLSPGATVIFSENFSGSYPGSWTIGHDGGEGTKEWAWPVNGFSYAHEYADPGGSAYFYPDDLSVYMDRRGVSLAGYSSAILSFQRIVQTEGTHDVFSVNVRDQYGAWHYMFGDSGLTTSSWTSTDVDLSAFAGQTNLYIQFRFDSDGSISGSPYTGVYLDNITLVGDTPSCPDIGEATYTSPVHDETITDTTPYINWSSVANSDGYQFQLWNHDFSINIIDEFASSSNYQVPSPLPEGTYYWRVKAYTDTAGCPDGDYSPFWAFHISIPNQDPYVDISDITGEPDNDTIYPTKIYTVDTECYDPDGRTDLRYCWLRLRHNGDETNPGITFLWNEDNKTFTPWAGGDGADWADLLNVSYSTEPDGYNLTWQYRLKWPWPESGNIDYGLAAEDGDGVHTGFEYDNTDAYFENDIVISGSTENNDPITEGDLYQVNGNVRFEGGSISPDNWSGISVEMRRGTSTGTLLDTDTSVSSGYSVEWDTVIGDVGNYDIYIVPKNTNHQPPNNSDIYWDVENLTVEADLLPTRFRGDHFVDKTTKIGVPVLLEAKLERDNSPFYTDIQGETIHFEIYLGGSWQVIPDDGISETSFVTDSNGIASVYYTPPKSINPSAYSIRASFSGSSIYDASNITRSLTINKPHWLFLYYLGNGGNLECGMENTFEAIASEASNENFLAYVIWDHDIGEDRIFQMKNNSDWDNGYTRNVDYWTATDIGLPSTELNMGDINTLTTFIDFVLSRTVGNHYGLILEDHGSGVYPSVLPPEEYLLPGGIMKDGSNYLSIADLGQGAEHFSNEISDNVDIFHFNACLMQMIEVGYEIKDHVDYIIASQNEGWMCGLTGKWEKNYLNTISSITNAPSLANSIASSWFESMVFIIDQAGATVSVLQSSHIDNVANAVDQLAEILIEHLPWIHDDILTARNSAQKFAYPDTDNTMTQSNIFLDLKDLSTELISHVNNSDIDNAANNVISAIGNEGVNIIRWEDHINESGASQTSGYWFDAGTFGLSIYFPNSKDLINGEPMYDNYISTAPVYFEFTSDTDWDDFIRIFLDSDDPICSISQPDSSTWQRGDIIVSATASDPTSDVRYVEFQYSRNYSTWYPLPGPDSPDGKDWYAPDGWSLAFQSTDTPIHGTITDSSVWVRARAMDQAGNFSNWSTSVSFGIDNTSPTFSTYDNTGNPKPGDYGMLQSISDPDSGVLDDGVHPKFYYRYSSETIWTGWEDGDWNGSMYEAHITVDESREGETIYWQVLAEDNVGNEEWSDLRDGGVIGDDDTAGPVFTDYDDSGDNPPGDYMVRVKLDDPSGILDDANYPRIYYRWNSDTVNINNNDGYVDADEDGLWYEAEINVDSSHVGDTLYWRGYAIDQDNSPSYSWGVTQTGGIITPITITIDDVSQSEGTSPMIFTVSLSDPSSSNITVNYTTSNGTAVSPDDYTPVTDTLTITAGNTSGTIDIEVIDDAVDETNETFTVNLSSPVNATLADAQGVGTIEDNDGLPTISIDDVTQNEGTSPMIFTVSLSNTYPIDVTVDYISSNGTAFSPDDYSAVADTLTILAGYLSSTIDVTIIDDNLDESNESFTVDLSNPVHATIMDPQGIGMIEDNDGTPSISIDDVSQGEGISPMSFTVSLTNPSASDVTVDYSTIDGSAVSPDDYISTTDTLTILSGATTGIVDIPIIDDILDEIDESFSVELINPGNAIISDNLGVGTIQDNDVPTASIVINEVDVGSPDQVELYNYGAQSVDLTGWSFVSTAFGETATFIIPSFTLPAGSYVILDEDAGTNTTTHLYFDNKVWWGENFGGRAALYDEMGNAVDYLRWLDDMTPPPAGTGWTGTNPPAVPGGTVLTLGRDPNGADTDDGSDWCLQTLSIGGENTGCERIDTIGMYSRSQKTWYLKDANDDGWGNVTTVRFGSTDSSWIPVVGDWNGNGTDTIAMYSRSQKTWYLKDANTDGWGDVTTVRFGSTDSSWSPVVGDWDGDGTDTIGIYSRTQKTWYLKDTNTDGWGDVSTVRFGSTDSSWIPVVGDWNGNGTDTIAMYSRTQKTWYLKGGNTDGWGDVSTVRFGSTDSSWIPVAGDWNGNDTDTIAMYSRTQKTWYLKDANNDGWVNVTTVRFGSTDTSWVPVTGTW